MKVPKEIIETIHTVAKWAVLIVGALCLLAYSHELGHLPEDISVGDGIAFYLISVGFLVAYTMYWITSTSMGSWIVSYLAQAHQKRERKKLTSTDQIPEVDYSVMRPAPVVGAAIVGLVATAIATTKDGSYGVLFFVASITQAILIALMLQNSVRLNLPKSKLVRADSERKTDLDADLEKTERIRSVQKALACMLVVGPLLLAPDKMFIVDVAFRVAQLRKENATVHVKAPWSVRMETAGLKAADSFMGADYKEFKPVPVLLRSLGNKVVLQLPQHKEAPALKLAVPVNSIYVE